MTASETNDETDDGARCPQCAKPLDLAEGSALVGYPCHGCGGLWLERATMSVVVTRLDPQAIMLGRNASDMAEDPAPPHAANPPCPMCGEPMKTFVMPATDVEVDSCDAHGTWLDRGELETLVKELSRLFQQAAETSDARPSAEQLADRHAIRQKMVDLYGLDPAIRATKLPFVLEEILQQWQLLTSGYVSPVPTFEWGQEDPDDDPT